MTQIAPLDGTPVPITALPSGAASPAPMDPRAAPAQAADPPAVIVSLSSSASGVAAAQAAAATAAPKQLGELDPTAVDDALSWTAGANGFADIAAHIDWSVIAKRGGQTVADQEKAKFLDGLATSTSQALSTDAGLGISAQDPVSPEAVKNGVTPGTITVSDFSFTSGGSTYTVTNGKDGTLVGTKDGQAWKTWQLTDPSSATSADNGAAAALQTLTALNAQAASATKPHSGLNVSA